MAAVPGRWGWQTAGPRNCGPKKLPADDRHALGLGDWPERPEPADAFASRENGVADENAKPSPCPSAGSILTAR